MTRLGYFSKYLATSAKFEPLLVWKIWLPFCSHIWSHCLRRRTLTLGSSWSTLVEREVKLHRSKLSAFYARWHTILVDIWADRFPSSPYYKMLRALYTQETDLNIAWLWCHLTQTTPLFFKRRKSWTRLRLSGRTLLLRQCCPGWPDWLFLKELGVKYSFESSPKYPVNFEAVLNRINM